ncbi:MAG: flagellar biosynthetic protein FliR [Acidobacteria bacterium]|nr:flagellar biosynthetic protein FliR [Acidobacteriota bacterium]
MPGRALLAPEMLFGFLLALARVSGVVAFLPVPGIRNAPDLTRIALAFSMTLCLSSSWPKPAADPGIVLLTFWVLAEAALGVLIGLCASVLVESFQLGTQVLGLQAGFSYASTVDPNSQADSTILQIFAQLLASILFFGLGFHRQLLALVAQSFQTIPPGTFVPNAAAGQTAINLTGAILSTGLRVAFPVVALLLLVDIALALLSRIQAQLQLMTLAYPAKMLTAIGFFAVTLWVLPSVAQTTFRKSLEAIMTVVGR